MIQILGIRKGFDPEKQVEYTYDTRKHSPPKAPNPADILLNWQKYIDLFHPDERYNLFFTQYDVAAHFRSFKAQYVMPFDIDFKVDGVYHEPEPEILALPALQNPYILILAQHLKIPPEKLGVIFTGHGYHILASLKSPFGKDYFEKNRIFYNSLCASINASYKQANLLGTLDTQFFKSGLAGFRLPGSENRKPGRPSVVVRVLKADMDCVDIDLQALSGLPVVKEAEQVVNYGPVDTEGVLNGCDFLKHCKAEPNSVSYGAWYGMLSIVGRCQDGEKLAHEYSKGHKSYNEDETKQKLEEAIASSGPRTCQNIGTLPGWSADKCKGCKHYGVKSPISIRSKDFIATASTGFHTVIVGPKGITQKPCYDDLRKHFAKERPYKIMGESGICYVWNGTHYEMLKDRYLAEYAQTHFLPVADNKMRAEFLGIVSNTNVTVPGWFIDTAHKAINFKNGLLDLNTFELSPHSRDRGFRYVLPYEYDEEAKCPRFEQFLDEIMCGDKDLQAILMEFVAHAFSGDFPIHGKTLVLTAEGSNGKSVFIDVIKKLASKANYSSLNWKNMNNPVMRAMLDGKLFNLSEESPKDALKDTTFFKNMITGGDILIDVKFKDPYEIPTMTKLIWACNEMPATTDTTKGFFRRFLIIPFNATFEGDKDDKQLRSKLFAELPGIFNLVRRAYARLEAQGGFTKSEASDAALAAYQDEMDHATRWIKENVTVFPKDEHERPYAVKSEMYQAYRADMLNTGEYPIKDIPFGKKLALVIPDYESRSVKRKKDRVLLNCTFRDKFQNSSASNSIN